MPRKPYIYTHEYPYHIFSRSNNKEQFPLELRICWNIFIKALEHVRTKFGLRVHSFVLMKNHYHMIATCSEEHNLGVVMHAFKGRVSREMNYISNRINHVFGSRYKASLIKDPNHYAMVYKYVARNPVSAHLVAFPDQYPFSTEYKNNSPGPHSFRTDSVQNGFDKQLNDYQITNSKWLEEDFIKNTHKEIQTGLKKNIFCIKNRNLRRQI